MEMPVKTLIIYLLLLFKVLSITYFLYSVKSTNKNIVDRNAFFGKPSAKLKTDQVVIKIDKDILKLIEDIEAKVLTTWVEVAMDTTSNYTCTKPPKSTAETTIDDLLCMTPPKFLATSKNPCWYPDHKPLRCLPYFQLIGMDKCSSTDLFDRIAKHPDVKNNNGILGKETKWWSWRRYGDGTPMDMWDMSGWVSIPQIAGLREPQFTTPHLIRHINPDVKLLITLRDPVERLYSDYFFLGLGKMTSDGFHTEVVKSIKLLHECTRVNSLRACLYSRHIHVKITARLHLGFYSIFIKDRMKAFKRDQFLICRTEDYSSHIGILKKCLSFYIYVIYLNLLYNLSQQQRRNMWRR